MHATEIICHPFVYVLNAILPTIKFPEIAFIIVMILFFIVTDFILTIVSVISVYSSLSHILIGTTLISWGSSAIEVINLSVAAKKNEMHLGMTSILSAIVLIFLVVMPFAMIFKMIKKQSYQI